MNTNYKIAFIPFYLSVLCSYAQQNKSDTLYYVKPIPDIKHQQTLAPKDNFLLGFGVGFDHGGIGFNLLFYPYKYIGVFAGVGYPFVGIGYNAGIKLRYVSPNQNARVNPFVTGMYGYNTVISVSNASRYDKMFYGLTVGAGIDLKFKPTHHNYLSLAILVPIRGPEVNEYINDLKTAKGVKFDGTLSPIGVSLGFKLPFNFKK